MPSLILDNRSGGQNILSGAFFSGHPLVPLGGIQLRLSPMASGNCYIAFSGGVTINSGGLPPNHLSGALDGMLLAPGDSYFIPKAFCGASGSPQIYIATDPAASGQARLYYEVM